MKTLAELREERVKLFNEMEGILTTAGNRDGKLTKEEAAKYDELAIQHDSIAALIENMRDQKIRQVEIAAARSFPGKYGGDDTRPVAKIKGFRTHGDELPPEDFWRCITQKDYGPLREYRAENRGAVAGIGAAGGFAIPEVTRLDVLDSLLQDQGIFSRIGKEFPAEGSDTLNIVSYEACDVDDEGLYGFSVPALVPESGTITPGTPKLVKRSWVLRKMVCETKISIEAATNRRLQSSLTGALSGVLKYGLEKHIVRGAGAQQTVGLLDSPCGLPYTRAGAGAIAYADTYNMLAITRPGAAPCWIAAQTIIPQLAAMVDSGGNATWLPGVSGGAAQPMPQNLFGAPLLFNIGVSPALGTAGDLIYCGDLSFFKAVLWQDIFVQTSESASWATAELNIRVIMLLDMGALPTKPITIDGQTYGWFSVLK